LDLADSNVHLVPDGAPLGVVQVPQFFEHHQRGVCGVDGLDFLLITLWAFEGKAGEETVMYMHEVRRKACF
jgi:hypothetical protein